MACLLGVQELACRLISLLLKWGCPGMESATVEQCGMTNCVAVHLTDAKQHVSVRQLALQANKKMQAHAKRAKSSAKSKSAEKEYVPSGTSASSDNSDSEVGAFMRYHGIYQNHCTKKCLRRFELQSHCISRIVMIASCTVSYVVLSHPGDLRRIGEAEEGSNSGEEGACGC
jgi:hypothetical protein